MSNLKMLKILNPIMAIAFLCAALAIIISKLNLAIIPGDLIYELHETAGAIFILLAMCHIILNWNWIKLNILGIKSKSKATKKKK
jgi:hypothetical protein